MKLLIACEHHPVTPARFMADAFEAMPNIDIRHIGTNRGGDTGYGVQRPEHAWKSHGDINHHWPNWTPDLVLYLDTMHEHYHHSFYRTVPHVWYHIEGRMDNVMPGMKHFFHAASYGPNWDKIPGKMTWLPPAYDPVIHTPSPIPWEEREYDVCLVGRLSGARPGYTKRLSEAGLSVYYEYGPIYEEYAALYHNARVSLVEHIDDIIPMRTFETAAMGNLLLSEWFADYDKLDIQGVVTIPDDIEQVGIKMRDLLDRPNECKALVRQSMEWVKPHTYAARAQTILDWFEENN